jgi:hypothetical protein
MVSIWWVVCGFLFGGLAGMAMCALMSMAAHQDERALLADKALQRAHLGRVSLEEHWRT